MLRYDGSPWARPPNRVLAESGLASAQTCMSSMPLHAPQPRLAHRPHSALYVAAVAALGGLLFGYDTGVISGALLFVKRSFHLGSTGQSVVVSAVLAGAAIGAGTAMLIGDRIGRKVLIAASAVVFIAGTDHCPDQNGADDYALAG